MPFCSLPRLQTELVRNYKRKPNYQNKLSNNYTVTLTQSHLGSLEKENLTYTYTQSPKLHANQRTTRHPLSCRTCETRVLKSLVAGVVQAWANYIGNTGGKVEFFPFLMGTLPKALAFKCMLQTPKTSISSILSISRS